jgi:NADPH:quinone reductase-like Zn-dependent oxidoreductase
MLAAYVEAFDPDNPIAALVVGERPEPIADDGWSVIDVRATSINHHDVWSLRGVGLKADRLPMILGCDAAGVDADGREVVVHPVIGTPGWRGDELADPGMSLPSERYQGTMAQRLAVPTANLIEKPAGLSFAEAACLPTAWLTAYRMLFRRSGLVAGNTVLVQGAGGGLSSALIVLARAAGMRVWVTGREEAKRAYAAELGAHQVFESGARLPERVDSVMDSVGAATWNHSLKALRPHGSMVVSGGTSGYAVQTDVARIFAKQLQIVGSAMGSTEDMVGLLRMCVDHDLHPTVQTEIPLAQAADGFTAVWQGDIRGKVVLVP